MKTFPKQPSERLAYDIDLTDWFQALNPVDYIQTAQVSVVRADGPGAPSDLVVSLNAQFLGVPPTIVKVWAEGGIDGTTYQVTLLVDTFEGRIKEVDFRIRVREI